MARDRFEHEIRRLREEVCELGAVVEKAIAASIAVLQDHDLPRAEALIAADRAINEWRFRLEGEALTLIATQQPMAGDLRALATVLELASELERMGDYAKGIATITRALGSSPPLRMPAGIPRMAELACGMLHRALEAYRTGDEAAACGIPREDSRVDALYEEVYKELAGHLVRDPAGIDQAMRLTWVAHNLERVADRVGNICERLVYSLTGRVEEMTDDSGLHPR